MGFQEEIKKQQEIRKANIVGQFKEPDLFFKATNHEEFLCVNLDIEKAKKIVVGYEHGGYKVVGFYTNGQPKWQSLKKHGGGKEESSSVKTPEKPEDGKDNGDKQKSLEEHAKNSSEADLQRAIKEHKDEKVRNAAHQELERRKSEEHVDSDSDEKTPTKAKPKSDKGKAHEGNTKDGNEYDEEDKAITSKNSKKKKAMDSDDSKSTLSPEAQTVLDKSLDQYEKAKPEAQKLMKEIVIKNLKLSEDGENSIGFPLASHMVEAGREFLNKVGHDPIGKTSSGKDVYDWANHEGHKDFDFQDHEEASQIQEKIFRNAPAHSVEGSHALRQSDEHDRALEKENPKEREKRRTENLIKSIDKLGSNILIGSKKSQVGTEKYRIAEGMNGLYQLQLTYDDDSFAKFRVTREELDNYLRTGDVPPNKK